ncbi:TVP38/TMEM64 family protein [Saccharothrix sp. NRRL B-16348]|uniref:TVP38/TMEM64 family protein n=1 Tax=Saccharothrix sp. NRRL B-16348 TaxID=1415542 RepID=UPI0006B058CD|nr:TVP38/TMEM64 family protein [Saccharothrix sp. NRRL B-16348]
MRHVRVVGLAVVVVALAVAAAVLDLPDPDQLRNWIDGNGAWAPLVFFLVCAVGTAAFFPKPVLATASGLLFGVLPGLVVAVAGFTVGALIAFVVARLLGRRSVARWLGSGRLKVLDTVFARNGLAATVVLRLLPVVPFAVSNYGAGVTAVTPKSFAAGTALGLLPTTALAATLGDAALDLGSPRAIAAGAAWLVLAVVGVVWGRHLLRRSKG